MIAKLNSINCDFYRHGVFLSFSGPMSQDLMVEMGNVLKTKMRLEGASMNTILNVFSILIELNQNIIHYSAERMATSSSSGPTDTAEKTGCGLIAIGREEDHYFLISGNVMESSKTATLKSRLEALNQMSPEERKLAYRKKRKGKPDSESKGAGLGFIEVSRKASQPLAFDFEQINDTLSFFSFKTVI